MSYCFKYVSMNTRWKRRNIEEKEVILVQQTVYANDFMSVKLSREQNANYRDAYINQFTCQGFINRFTLSYCFME